MLGSPQNGRVSLGAMVHDMLNMPLANKHVPWQCITQEAL